MAGLNQRMDGGSAMAALISTHELGGAMVPVRYTFTVRDFTLSEFCAEKLGDDGSRASDCLIESIGIHGRLRL